MQHHPSEADRLSDLSSTTPKGLWEADQEVQPRMSVARVTDSEGTREDVDRLKHMTTREDDLRRELRPMLAANRHHSRLATALHRELRYFAEWLDLKRDNLQASYRRYCEIMRENGAEPEILYPGAASLNEARERFLIAAGWREEVEKTAISAAQREGNLDMHQL